MSGWQALMLLALVACLAWAARERQGAELVTTGVVVDASSASHLRQAEVILAQRALPARDAFVAEAGAVSGSAAGVALCATLARLVTARSAADGARTVPESARLEALAQWSGPLLAAVAVLGLFFALCFAAGGPRRTEYALLGAALFALSPAAAREGAAGLLGVGPLHAALAAWSIAAAMQVARTRTTLDALTNGWVAGAIGGLACVLGAPALIYVPFSALAAWSVGRDARSSGQLLDVELRRAAVVMSVVFAAIVIIAARSGRLGAVAWLEYAGNAALAWTALLELDARRRAQPRARALFGVGLALLGAWLVLSLARLASALFALGTPRFSLSSALLRDPLPLLALAATLILWRAPRLGREDLARPFLAVLAGAVAAALFLPGLDSLAALAAAAGIALAGERLATPRAEGSRHSVRAALTALALLGLVAATALRDAPRRVTRAEATVVEALRWMRDRAPFAPPWPAHLDPMQGAVLAPPALGPLIAYHSRRPPLAAGLAATERADAELGALYATGDAEHLARAMAHRGARYLLVGAAFVRGGPELALLAPEARVPEDAVVHRLSLLLSGNAAEARYFALEGVFGTSAVQRGADVLTVPTVALYRLQPPSVAPKVQGGPRDLFDER